MNQIRTSSYFKPADSQWFSESAGILFHRTPNGPFSQAEYTRILQKAAPTNPEEKSLFLRKALRSLLFSMPDPYAAFMSPSEITQEQNQAQGRSFLGFGLYFFQQEGRPVEISGVLPGSPAQKAGVFPGDLLAEINGKKVRRLQEALAWIHAEKGIPLHLTLLHGRRLLHYSLLPVPIRLTPLSSRQLKKAGYISMEIIPPKDDRPFLAAAQTFENHGDDVLILDLRNCAGGDVATAARMAGYFLEPGDVVYHLKTAAAQTAYRNAVAAHLKIPLVILTNHATASAAELLTGALKDHRRALVIGETTVGKGVMQTTFRLRDGSEMKFTTAAYLTPSGTDVSGRGIRPNIEHPWGKGESLNSLETLVDHALR